MPSWKKLIVSGSDASLSSLTATSYGGNISGSATSTGSFGVLQLNKFNAGIGDNTNVNFGVGAGATGASATNNLAIGYNAGSFSNAGSSLNIAIGWDAQGHWTDADGDRNIAIGYQAMYDHNGGDDNIAIGYQAMKNGEGSGMDNIAIGTDAMQVIGAGASRNIGLGDRAQYNLVGGTDNVSVGKDSLFTNVDGDYNVAFGTEALYGINAESADKNVAVGYRAGIFIANGSTQFTDGDSNVFIGSETKPAADDESNQIIIGANAIGKGSNTALIGDDNITDIYMSEDLGAMVHVGNISGSATSTGSFGHLLVGGSELASSPNATDGSQSTISGSATSTGSFGSVMQNGKHFPQVNSIGESFAFGTNAGSAFLGDSVNRINIAIGSNAGTAMADYGGNVYIGKNAAKLRTRGDSNVCIGSSAGGTDGDDFGDKNVFIGLSTGLAINSTNSDSNVFIGNLAGTAGQQSIANVLIGDRAGNTLTDSSRNVAIGIFAGTGFGVTNTTTENGVYIGQYARTSATNANNEIVIGSEAVGHGTDTITFGDNQITDVYFASGSSTGATFHGIKDFAGNISGSSTSTGSFGAVTIDGSPNIHGSSTGANYAGGNTGGWGFGTTEIDGAGITLSPDGTKSSTALVNNSGLGITHTGANGSYSALQINTGAGKVLWVGNDAKIGIKNSDPVTELDVRGTISGSNIEAATKITTLGKVAIGTATLPYNGLLVSDPGGASSTSLGNVSGVGITTSGTNTSYYALQVNTGTGALLRVNNGGIVDFPSATKISGSATSTGSFGAIQSAGNITPKVDDSVDLGAADKRFKNIFTTDLQLSNEGKDKGNEVDGTTGSWTIQEGEEELYLLNRKNGKKYKFMLQEIK